MLKLYFIGIILFFHSHISKPFNFTCLNFSLNIKDSSDILKDECIKTIKSLNPSISSKTSQGNEYNLYALKKGKEWTYLILDNNGYYTLTQPKGKEDVSENNQTYTDMIVLMVKAKMISKVAKPKNVSGMTFSCYYKFKPKAKTMYKQYRMVQGRVEAVNDNVKNSASGILKMFKKK